MDCVFVDNYRGFQHSLIPIRRANFLVGENSTGKTSILALCDLLSRPEFWFGFDFNSGGYEFGGFDDIVSVFSDDKTEFRIGLVKGRDEFVHNEYHMLHFRKAKDGLPTLTRYSILHNSFLATMGITRKRVAVLVRSDVSGPLGSLSPEACFSFLFQVPETFSSGYRILDEKKARIARSAPVPNFPRLLKTLFQPDELGDLGESFPIPAWGYQFASLAPIRTKPRRTYDGFTRSFSDDGEHTPYVIQRMLQSGRQPRKFRTALEEFGRNSGLFQRVGIRRFGEELAAPFELTVTLASKPLRVNSVGYGVSQALPVIVELLRRGSGSYLAVQQPEVHLHPRAQAALGDVLFHAADEGQTLLIETHSDYILDRFRRNFRDREIDAGFAQLLFFERTEIGNSVRPMTIGPRGEYPSDQPDGFRKFFLKEQKEALGL